MAVLLQEEVARRLAKAGGKVRGVGFGMFSQSVRLARAADLFSDSDPIT